MQSPSASQRTLTDWIKVTAEDPDTTITGPSGSTNSTMVTVKAKKEEVRKLNDIKRTHEFKHLIQDEKQAQEYFDTYLSLCDDPSALCPDLPQTAKAKQNCVKRIVEAMESVDKADDRYATKSKDPAPAVRFIESLTCFEKQLVAWRLLEYIIHAARGQYGMPSWADSITGHASVQPHPETFTCFSDRFETVIATLTRWKFTVRKLVNDVLCNARRIAINPDLESRQRERSRKVDKQHKERVTSATERMKARSRTKNGMPRGQGKSKAKAKAQAESKAERKFVAATCRNKKKAIRARLRIRRRLRNQG